jgi:hypothetical protein
MLPAVLLESLNAGMPVRSRDFAMRGVSRLQLSRLTAKGFLVRDGLFYSLPGGPGLTHAQRLAAAHPNGVLCLITAQKIHDLTDDFESYGVIALPRGTWVPRGGDKDRFISWKEPLFYELGVEKIDVGGGVIANVTDRFRTVADMFRPRYLQDTETAMRCLGEIARTDGERGLNMVASYAFKMHFGAHLQSAVRALKELIPCVKPTK